jgi:hypothetical protein
MEKKFQEELGHDIKKHHKLETIAAFAVLGVVAAAIGVGAWWYMTKLPSYDATPASKTISKKTETSSATDETSDWKIYTNEVFDFTMKYPGTWTLADKLQTVKTAPGAANKALTFTNGTKYNLVLWINPDGFGYENVSNTYSYTGSTVAAKKITLGAKETSTNPEGDGSFMVTTTVTNGTDRYIFAVMGDDSADITAADDYFKKIIATYQWL